MKTKALISYAITTQLICSFVFAYAKSRSSHDVAVMFLNVFIRVQNILLFSSIAFILPNLNLFALMLLYVS